MDLLILVWSTFVTGFVVLNISLPLESMLPNFLHETITYGKIRRSPEPKLQCFSINKRWFTLFYAWGLVWNLVVLYHFTSTLSGRNGSGVATSVSYLLQILFFPNTPPQSPCCCTPLHTQVLLALLLVCFHTGRRLVECLCVTVFSEESKIHLLHCVFGMFFYTALGPGALDDLRKADKTCSVSVSLFMIRPHQILAIAVFAWSSWHQYRCHKILALLRTQNNDGKTHEKRLYDIPHGDWFQFCSSPHYLAEILIHFSLFLLLGLSNVYSLLSLATSTLNLLHTARLNHAWYYKSFRLYPKRCALIPFVI